jgi:hypothetical protein
LTSDLCGVGQQLIVEEDKTVFQERLLLARASLLYLLSITTQQITGCIISFTQQETEYFYSFFDIIL